ncbi:transketolase [Candidatus Woesearchaeota archaeon]|nr:transketolase [Candidatus Woesearchaeota archaeon]MCF7900814.1 transketolase [Candidatus Woesearchaeota archaeon]MCF8013116.1 transketolase [Candidatus Woesearchaeota archaeon]
MKTNGDLRYAIANTVYSAGEGHIPSAYSIIDIINVIYGKFLNINKNDVTNKDRDYFILSKGHGAVAYYVVLEKYGFITKEDLMTKSKENAILGGHPDCTKVPGVEASTGSLGHGAVTALGIALGLKIKQQKNKVITIIGDGESNEGSIWESALVAANLKLGNLCYVIDNNKSTEQILPMTDMAKKWESFGWEVYEIDGHDEEEILKTFQKIDFSYVGKPKLIIANTIKGKGVSFIEGHGPWHHKVPSDEELQAIKEELL